MKILKIKALIAAIILGGLFFTACDEDTTTGPTGDSPFINSISPADNAAPGETITISGTDFGLATDDGSVKFKKGSTVVEAKGEVGEPGSDYESWSNTEIKVKIPADAPTGVVDIIVENEGVEGNSYTYYIGPADPTDLKATSISSTEVKLVWTASTTNGVTYSVYDGDGNELKSGISGTETIIGGLTEGMVYEFTIRAMLGASESKGENKISWAPAKRLGETMPISFYGKASSMGSGLDLYDMNLGLPKVLTIANRSDWDLALNDDGGTFIQSGSAITVGSSSQGEPNKTEISDVYFENTSSLDMVYDFEGLNTSNHTYAARSINIDDKSVFGDPGNIVLIVRTTEEENPADGDWHYAKVMLIRGADGEFLQGTGADAHVKAVISYQTTGGVPYARDVQ